MRTTRPHSVSSPPRFTATEFIAQHPVFRFDEFRRAHTAAGRSPETTAALLQYHVSTGRLRNLRRGLYARIQYSGINHWLVGSRLAPDAVLAYDGALSFYRLTGLGHGISFLTRERVARFVFDEVVYQPVAPPAALATSSDRAGGIVKVEREGIFLSVTTPERALVDVCDRVDLAPLDENLFEAFRAARDLDVDFMIHHLRRLGNRLAAARLGFFLERLPGASADHLRAIERLRPRGPAYFDRRKADTGDPFLSRWNLVVPRDLFDQAGGYTWP